MTETTGIIFLGMTLVAICFLFWIGMKRDMEICKQNKEFEEFLEEKRKKHSRAK